MGQILSSSRDNTLKLSKGPNNKKRDSISKSQVANLIKQSKRAENSRRDSKQTNGAMSKDIILKRYESS
jgi:hypothetical protein